MKIIKKLFITLKSKSVVLNISLIITVICPLSAIYGKDRFKLIATINGDEISKPFNLPCSLFYDESKGRLYLADTGNNRLVSFDTQFTYLSEFTAEGKLNFPVSIVKDSKGELVITESNKNQVTVINVIKKTISALDFSKVPDKNSIITGRLAIDNKDNLYLVDKANRRILIFNDQKRYVREITAKKDIAGFKDVKLDNKGNIYTIDVLNRRIYVFNNAGKIISKFGKEGTGKSDFSFPVSLAVDKRGLIYVADRHKNKIMIFNRKGNFQDSFSQFGWSDGSVNYPEYIFIDDSQRIYIVDRDNNRINVYKLSM